MTEQMTVGFLPLVDACLPILAHEHGCPAHVALEGERQPFLLGETVRVGEDRQAGVDEGQEADGHLFGHCAAPVEFGPSSSCAVTTASAMSRMRRLELIALRLSSA